MRRQTQESQYPYPMSPEHSDLVRAWWTLARDTGYIRQYTDEIQMEVVEFVDGDPRHRESMSVAPSQPGLAVTLGDHERTTMDFVRTDRRGGIAILGAHMNGIAITPREVAISLAYIKEAIGWSELPQVYCLYE